MEYTERLTIRVTEEQKELLENLADQRSTAASAIARQILQAGLKEIQDGESDPAQISILDGESDTDQISIMDDE